MMLFNHPGAFPAQVSCALSGRYIHDANGVYFPYGMFDKDRAVSPIFDFSKITGVTHQQGDGKTFAIRGDGQVANNADPAKGAYLQYLSMASQLRMFLTGWDFNLMNRKIPGENPGLHHNVFGEVTALPYEAVWIRPEKYWPDYTWDYPNHLTNVTHLYRYDSFAWDADEEVFGVTPTSSYSMLNSKWLTEDNYPDWETVPLYTHFLFVFRGNYVYLQDVYMKMTATGIEFTIYGLHGAGTKVYVGSNRVSYTFAQKPQHPLVLDGVLYDVEDFLHVTTDVTIQPMVQLVGEINQGNWKSHQVNLLRSNFLEPTIPITDHEYAGFDLEFMLAPGFPTSDGLFTGYTGISPYHSTYSSSSFGVPDRSARYYFHLVDKSLPELVGACALSAQDAFDKNLPALENNYLETLGEIGSILTPREIPLKFWEFAMKRIKKEKGAGVTQLIELLANANITYKFGVAPNIGAAKELAYDLEGVLTAMQDLRKAGVSNGSAKWSDIELIPGHHVSIVARTKIVWEPQLDCMLPFLIPADKLGFLPTLSRVWETLPWSWLIDYAIPIKKTLRLIDVAAFSLVSQIDYSVSTLKVEYSFDHLDEQKGAFLVNGDAAGYRTFLRIVTSDGIPLLGPMRPELLGIPRVPPWDIIGSLVVLRR